MSAPWFFTARALSDVYGTQLAPGYAVFDTWSFHYENDGLNEDQINSTVQVGCRQTRWSTKAPTGWTIPEPISMPRPERSPPDTRLGPDDVGERETAPPYDKPLRGVQVILRLYERDSRQIRQVSVNQSFVPE